MSKFVTFTTLAALTLSAVAMQTTLASAGPIKTIMGGDSSGGGHSHHPDFNISFNTYGGFDPTHFCRLVLHKHRLVRVCYISQTSYAPSVSFGYGW